MNKTSTSWKHLQHQPWRMLGVALALLLISGLIVPLAGASPAHQENAVLRVGHLGSACSDTANGAQLAIEQINEAGGITTPDGTIYELELVQYSEGILTAETLPDAIDSLVAQGVDIFLGPNSFSLLTEDNIDALVEAGLPVLSAGTYNLLTDDDEADVIFRTRAPEYVYSYALGAYMVEDLGLESFALVQVGTQYTEPLLNFEAFLNDNDLDAADKIQLSDGSALLGRIDTLLALDPDAIVLWSGYADAATLLEELRDQGWNGVFAYRYAEEAVRAGALDDDLKMGVLGVTSWSYGYPGRTAQIFLRDYVVSFGEVPGPLSAAAYDAMWYVWSVAREQGASTEDLLAGLIGGSPRTLVQGTLHPVDFGNGDLARLAMVYELGDLGGPTVVARFDDAQRLPIEEEDLYLPEPTATAGPPTNTPAPTATLDGTYALVTAKVLNVRSGPGFEYDKVGQVSEGDLLEILGTTADYSWLTVTYQGGVGWIKTEYVTVEGSLSDVTFLTPPSTPLPTLTQAPTLSPNPDIIIQSAVLSPSQPVPNRAFSATVTVVNQGGGAAGRFAVAASFPPNSVYAASFVEGLAAGQTAQVQLNGTLSATGIFSVEIVADLNQEVSESNEDNNKFNLTYRVDYPLYAQQSNIQMAPGTDWDLYGGTVDFNWDGYNITMKNGALIGIVGGTYEDAHFDLLGPGVVNNAVGIGTDKATPGTVFGIYTAEGQRAVLRIDNRQDTQIWITYRVYNNTP